MYLPQTESVVAFHDIRKFGFRNVVHATAEEWWGIEMSSGVIGALGRWTDVFPVILQR